MSLTGAVLTAAAGLVALDTSVSALVPVMARDLGITEAEATTRLAAQTRASDLDAEIRDRLGADAAGAFFDPASGSLIVNIVDETDADLVRSLGATPRDARFRQSELDDVMSRLDARVERDAPGVTGWYTDSERNRVVVEHLPGVDPTSFVAGLPSDLITFEEVAEAPTPLIDVIGGNAYRIGGGRCSVGFPTANGFLTAGHCGKTGESTTGPTGRFQVSRFPGSDYALVVTAAGNTPKPLVNRYNGSTVPVRGSRDAADGASGCRSGSTTQWHCGQLVSRNATVKYPQGSVNGLIKTTICAEPGDSGGSMLAGDQAQGVTSGGSGDCKRGGTTYFQPINPAMSATGARILTG